MPTFKAICPQICPPICLIENSTKSAFPQPPRDHQNIFILRHIKILFSIHFSAFNCGKKATKNISPHHPKKNCLKMQIFCCFFLLIAFCPLHLDGALLYRLDFDKKKIGQAKRQTPRQHHHRQNRRQTPTTIPIDTVDENKAESKAINVEAENKVELKSSADSAAERQRQLERWQQFKHDCFFTPLNCQFRRPILPSWMKKGGGGRGQRHSRRNSAENSEMAELIAEVEIDEAAAELRRKSGGGGSSDERRPANGELRKRKNGRRRRPSSPWSGVL